MNEWTNEWMRESKTDHGDTCPLIGLVGVQATSPTYIHSCAKGQTQSTHTQSTHTHIHVHTEHRYTHPCTHREHTYMHPCTHREHTYTHPCIHTEHIYMHPCIHTNWEHTTTESALLIFITTGILSLTHLGTSTAEPPSMESLLGGRWGWRGRERSCLPWPLGHFCSNPVSSIGFPWETPLQRPY